MKLFILHFHILENLHDGMVRNWNMQHSCVGGKGEGSIAV